MKIRPNCAARTHENDIRPIAEISQRVGLQIAAATFLGQQPDPAPGGRLDRGSPAATTEKAVKFAVAQGLPVMYVTEDTIRTDPDTVKKLYTTAIECGARAVVLCDTVGHATPMGAYALVKFVRRDRSSSPRAKRFASIGTAIAIAAWPSRIRLRRSSPGPNQVHAAANSLGERVGNTPMELMLVNLRLLGLIDRDLSRLKEYCDTVARATHTEIPPNYPVVGRDAFPHRDRCSRRRDRQGLSQSGRHACEFGL